MDRAAGGGLSVIVCRLYGFRATEETKVECTLVLAQNALLAQSQADLRGKTHADGWGIAYYENGLVHSERLPSAAFDTLHFSVAAERVFAKTVIAHVRRATVSGISPANTHPFIHGRWTFAHNGTVRAFDRVAPLLESETDSDLLRLRLGSTDSELVFFWLLSRMRHAEIDLRKPVPDSKRLVVVVGDAIHHLADLSETHGAEKPAELNFMLTDGDVLLASRWHNSLHWVERRGVHDCEICGIPHIHHEETANYRAMVAASEPISTDEDWQELPDHSVLLVDHALQPEIISL